MSQPSTTRTPAQQKQHDAYRRWYVKHRAEYLAKCKKYRQKNRAACIARTKSWEIRNAEHIREKRKTRHLLPEVSGAQRDRSRKWYRKNRTRRLAIAKIWVSRRKHGLKKFGLIVADYDKLLDSQKGCCKICGCACSTKKRLAVDHDHRTGRVRGLLCRRCNSGLGFFSDDAEILRRALAYMEAFR